MTAVPTTTTFLPSPASLELNDLEKLSDLLTIICSFISSVAIVFAMVLYGHMPHLHSRNNLVFIGGVLGADLLGSVTYFTCVFFVDVPTRLTSAAYCTGCGFMIQLYSFCEPAMAALFWLSLFWRMFIDVRGMRIHVLAYTTAAIVTVGLASGILAVEMDMLVRSDSPWCWVAGAKSLLWFRLSFCWIWIALASCLMLATLLKCLLSSEVSPYEKRLLLRRGTLAVAYLVINATDVASRLFPSDGLTVLVSALDPLSGVVNVVAFLFSEKMLTIHALGLPPTADPPRGFTAVMHDLPFKTNRLQKETSFLLTHNTVAL
jgi:hypothetical protein